MKKIRLLYTGGTFGMRPLEPEQTLAPSVLTDVIAQKIPEVYSIANIDTEIIFNLDSSNMHIPHWQTLAERIATHIDHYDGFVVVHGTDAMVYSATALSFMLSNLPKPVIFTGSQKPIAALRSDAKNNLIDAIELACHDIPEVCIMFDNRLYRANRTIKVSSTHFDAFVSPNFPPLAEIGLDLEIKGIHRRNEGFFHLQKDFDDRVMFYNVFPGMKPEYLEQSLQSDVQAILLEAFGVGNVPISEKSLIPFIKKAVDAGKVVAITSQVPHGYVDLTRYNCGKQAHDAGAISAFDMTSPAALVKLMFLCGQLSDRSAVIKHFQKSIAGEMKQPL